MDLFAVCHVLALGFDAHNDEQQKGDHQAPPPTPALYIGKWNLRMIMKASASTKQSICEISVCALNNFSQCQHTPIHVLHKINHEMSLIAEIVSCNVYRNMRKDYVQDSRAECMSHSVLT